MRAAEPRSICLRVGLKRTLSDGPRPEDETDEVEEMREMTMQVPRRPRPAIDWMQQLNTALAKEASQRRIEPSRPFSNRPTRGRAMHSKS